MDKPNYYEKGKGHENCYPSSCCAECWIDGLLVLQEEKKEVEEDSNER